jgi:hypothetical protein
MKRTALSGTTTRFGMRNVISAALVPYSRKLVMKKNMLPKQQKPPEITLIVSYQELSV